MNASANQRNRTEYVWLWIKGMGMGAADLIPGVSGGTVALVVGIYDELVLTISNLHPRLLRDGFRTGWGAAWQQANGAFLAVVIGGMVTSILLLSSLLHHLLNTHQTLLFSGFFGLVAGSIPLVGRTVSRWSWKLVLFGLAGALVAATITTLPPIIGEPSLIYIGACAALAACAMILPGISGSFILLLLGAYSTVIGALKSFDLTTIGVVAIGAGFGILGFSRILQSILTRYRDATLSVLTGFLLGSLQALWPWKQPLYLLYTHSDGGEVWSQTNAMPSDHSIEIGLACAVALAAAFIITLLDRWGNSRNATKS